MFGDEIGYVQPNIYSNTPYLGIYTKDDGNPNGYIPNRRKEKITYNKHIAITNFRNDLTNYVRNLKQVKESEWKVNIGKECDYVLSIINFEELFDIKDSNSLSYCICQNFLRLYNISLTQIEVSNLCKKNM